MRLTPHLRVKNSEQKFPAIYYGLHMVPGVAEYADGPGNQPYRVFINGDTAKRMDPSFATRPVYVEHVDDEKPNAKNKTVEGITQDDNGNPEAKVADGYVIESFYNPADGMHWAKFIVTSEEGVRAIERGWKLSNCYQPINLGPGGEWHGVSYSREFTDAEYRHLAIVGNPRYRESVIFTPEQFKEYNQSKVAEIAALRNSADVQKAKPIQGEKKMSLLDKFFGRKNGKIEKVENAKEIGAIEVNLGKNRRVTIAELVKNAEKMKDEDYEKMMVETADRPEHNDDEDEDEDEDKENDLEDLKDLKDKKNKKKSDDEDVENDDDEDKKNDAKDEDKENDLEDLKDLKDKKNKKKSDDEDVENDDDEDAKMKALRDKKNKKKSDDEDVENDDDEEKKNEDFKGRGTGGEKDFIGNKKNRKGNDDEEVDNDDQSPLKHVVMLDDEETTVGEMINAHMDLKNKYSTLRQKHNDLKEEYGSLRAKYGSDDEFQNEDIPERDADMQEALGKLENEETALENSLSKRKNTIEKIIGKMKNSKDAVAKRDQKKQDGEENMKRLQNAELEAALNAESVMATPTETSASMVARGKDRYGSK